MLHPLEPLSLSENQHVFVTLSDLLDKVISPSRTEEMGWLSAHQSEFRGLWVALQDSQLLSSGPKALPVREDVKYRLGVRACDDIIPKSEP